MNKINLAGKLMLNTGVKPFFVSILIALVLAITGCGSIDVIRGVETDSGPRRQVDVSDIPAVVPVPEPIVRAGNYSTYTVLGGTYEVLDSSRGYREIGVASWYGTKFHGRLTSNGEVYDMYQITAAHKTLPIPAYVLVRNLENDRELIVRVNDRGPFHDDRIIDLSWAAAAKLGYADTGVARVEVIALDPNDYQTTLAALAAESNPQPELVESPLSPEISIEANELSYLQIAALSNAESARDLADNISQLTEVSVEIILPSAGESLYRVLAGPMDDAGELALLQTLLELNGLPPGYRVSRDSFSVANCIPEPDLSSC